MNIEKLLLKVLNDKASTQEYLALESWKKESEENLKLLNELQAKHHDIQDGYKDYDKNAAWHKIETRLIQSEIPQKKPAFLLSLALASVLISSIIYFFIWNDKPSVPNEFNSTTEKIQFALEDQSEIWLREGDGQLNILTDFDKERRVALEGEAFFDIAHDSEKPFVIELNSEDYIKVLGTSFNLIHKGDEFDLTLFSGVVELHMQNRTLRIEKGYRATKVDGALVKLRNIKENSASWKSELLNFDNVSAIDAFADIENHFNVTIDYSAPSNDLSKCAIRTKFSNENLDGVLKEISEILGFTYTNENGQVIITDLECS